MQSSVSPLDIPLRTKVCLKTNSERNAILFKNKIQQKIYSAKLINSMVNFAHV